jgi:DNA-binding XRE family transcriptional regulator
MLVHAKAPRIKVEISGTGSRKVAELVRFAYPDVVIVPEAVELSKPAKKRIRVDDLGDDESVNVFETDWWKEQMAKHKPGDSIWVYRDNAGLTLAQLSKKTGIAESHLSAMENNKRGIGRITAIKLGKALKCDYRRFL